jgi:hypothetical protein
MRRENSRVGGRRETAAEHNRPAPDANPSFANIVK